MADRAFETTLNKASPALGTLGNLRRRAQGVSSSPEHDLALARLTLDAAMLVTAGVAATMGASAAGVSAPPGHWILLSASSSSIFAARGMYGLRLHFEMLEDVRVVVAATSLAARRLSAREMFGNPPTSRQTIRMWRSRRPIWRPAGSLSTGRGQGHTVR